MKSQQNIIELVTRLDMWQACNEDIANADSCPADCAFNDMEQKVAEVQRKTQEVIEDMGRKFAQKQGHHFTLLLKEELERRSGKLHQGQDKGYGN